MAYMLLKLVLFVICGILLVWFVLWNLHPRPKFFKRIGGKTVEVLDEEQQG